MKTKQILNYRVYIEAEKTRRGVVYAASCPTLGLFDNGRTIDEALKNITSLIEFHIETLVQLGRKVPIEIDSTTLITSVAVPAYA